MVKKRSLNLCVIFVFICGGICAAGINDGLYGYWSFNQGQAAIAIDNGTGQNDGSLTGGAQWIQGAHSNAVELDGKDDFVDVPGFNLSTNAITFAAWIKADSAGFWPGIINTCGTNKCGLLLRSSTGELGYYWMNSSSSYSWSSGLYVPLNEWTFAAVVIESTKTVIYLKTQSGNLQYSIHLNTHPICQMSGVVFGKDSSSFRGDYDRKFDGAIDEVRIYDRALSISEITELSNQSDCWNSPPEVDISDKLVWFSESAVLSCNVTDDGKPYVQGCDSNNPVAGSPYPHNYLWQKISGPGDVIFDNTAAAQPTVNFTAPGEYRIRIQVWDGPLGQPESEYGMKGEAKFTIYVQQKELLGDWRFEEAQGQIANDIAGTNDLAYFTTLDTALPQWTQGVQADAAVDFAQSNNSYIKAENASASYSNLVNIKNGTVAAWFRYSPDELIESGVPVFSIKTAEQNEWIELESSISINDSSWHHIAACYDSNSGQMRLYINAKLSASKTIEPAVLSSQWIDLLIGTGSDAFEQSWSGGIDDVQVFNYALDAGQIRSLMTCSEIVKAGMAMTGDISGSNSQPDCRIDLKDIAKIALEWMTDIQGYSRADISGPNNEPDAAVDMYDLTEVIKDWLKCNDPQISCE